MIYTRHSPIKFGRHDTCKNIWPTIPHIGWENSSEATLAERETTSENDARRSSRTQPPPVKFDSSDGSWRKVCRTSTQHYHSLNLRWRQTSCRELDTQAFICSPGSRKPCRPALASHGGYSSRYTSSGVPFGWQTPPLECLQGHLFIIPSQLHSGSKRKRHSVRRTDTVCGGRRKSAGFGFGRGGSRIATLNYLVGGE